jgi:predicted amidohydrolase YtcJ
MTQYGKRLYRYGLGCALALAMAGAPLAAQQPADTILHNGKVLTVDKNFTIAEAIAVRGDQIAAVGKDADVMKLAGPSTKVIDLKGRTVIPGIIDTHNHIHDYSENNYGGYIGYDGLKAYPVDFSGVKTTDDALAQIRSIVQKYKFPPNDWQYFAPTGLNGGDPGAADVRTKILFDGLTRYELDKVAPNFGLVMALGFPNANGVVANSIVINKLFAEHGDFIKKNGRYWIDSAGKPDGHLEAPAVRLAMDDLVQPDPKLVAKIYKMYADELNAEGVTTISTRLPQYAINAFKYLEATNDLSIRLPYGLEGYFGNLEDLDKLKDIAKLMGTGSDKLWVVSIAPSAVDGAGIRSCTNLKRNDKFSALDAWWPTGQCILDVEYKGAKGGPISENYFRNWVMKSGQYGARFANTHITGDRSIKMMLGMMDELVKQYGPNSVKGWAFDHCFLVDPKDLPHVAKLGAMFSCYSQANGVAEVAATWGDAVANTFSIPVKTMMKDGVLTAYESDGDKSKWKDLEWFMDRKDPKGKVWGPQEALDHQEVLRYFTINGAKYVLRGDKIGSLETGKLADLAVLDKDFMATDPADMKNMQPQMTMLGGKVVFATPTFADENDLRKPGVNVATLAELKARRKRLGVSRR